MGDAVFLELAQGMVVGLGFGDAPDAREYLAVVEIEKGVDQPAQILQFLVLADGDVAGQDLAVGAAGPGGQAHVGLVGVGTGLDELGGGLAVDGVAQLVLDGGEEKRLVVGRRGCSRC